MLATFGNIFHQRGGVESILRMLAVQQRLATFRWIIIPTVVGCGHRQLGSGLEKIRFLFSFLFFFFKKENENLLAYIVLIAAIQEAMNEFHTIRPVACFIGVATKRMVIVIIEKYSYNEVSSTGVGFELDINFMQNELSEHIRQDNKNNRKKNQSLLELWLYWPFRSASSLTWIFLLGEMLCFLRK